MIPKSLVVFACLLSVTSICSAKPANDYIDISLYNSTYYNPNTGVAFKAELEDGGREPLSSARISFRGMPCECEGLTCTCCAGVNLTTINFNRRACTKFSYDPYEFAIKMQLSMNEREIYANALSAKNPPPLCAPFAYFPLLSFCVRFFDIYTPGRNFHACIDFETRIVGSPILILHFDCVKIGQDGISWVRPDGSSEAGNSTVQTKPVVSEPEVYDEVDFEEEGIELSINTTSTLTPEEEALIGQLKL